MRPPAMPPKRYGDEEFYHPEAAEGEQHTDVRNEKTPGVYTREVDSPQELDMLWSSTRLDHKEDRSPIVFFLVGFLLGSLITGLIVFLLTKQPEITTGESEVSRPVEDVKVVDEEPAPAATLKTEPEKPAPAPQVEEPAAEAPKAEPQSGPFGGLFGGKKSEKPATEPKADKQPAATAPKTYVVQSGDTLGGIAYRQYGSSAPQYVEKIQQANNLKSPDSLQLGQKLVIPAR